MTNRKDGGWLPISEAPKDGTPFLVCLPRMMNLIVRCRYDRIHKYFITDNEREGIERPHFFHEGDLWHPYPSLPPAPKKENDDGA